MVQPEGGHQPPKADQATALPPTPGKPSAAPPAQPSVSKGYAYLFKFVLVGDSGVGKTALLKRFSRDVFTATHDYTVGVDFDIKTLDLSNGDEIKLQMWDTAGQERFRTITTSYYRGANGIIIVYDVTNEESFQNVSQWLQEVQRYCNDDALCVIIGTKSDLAHEEGAHYGRDEVMQLLKDKDLLGSGEDPSGEVGVYRVYEVSAKTGEGVMEAFRDMSEQLVTRRLNERNPLRGGGRGKMKSSVGHDTIHLGQDGKKPKGRCC